VHAEGAEGADEVGGGTAPGPAVPPDLLEALSSGIAELRSRERGLLQAGLSFSVADARLPDLPLVWVSPAFTALTGYPVEEAVGQNCRFLRGGLLGPESTALGAAAVAGEATVQTLLNVRRDGTVFHNRVALSPVRDADGVLTHVVGVQTDVTDLVEAARDRDAAAAAEHEARLLAEGALARAEETRRHLDLLADTEARLSGHLDEETCRQRLAGLTVPALGDRVVVWTDEGRGRPPRVQVHPTDDPAAASLAAAAAASSPAPPPAGAVVLGADARRLGAPPEPALARLLDGLGLLAADGSDGRTAVVVALPGGGQVLDVAVVVREPGRVPLSADEVVLAAELGLRSGAALHAARVAGEQRTIAETLQRSLLPVLPAVPGVTAAARYRAAATGASVGGDFYELLDLTGGAVGVAVGDVAGHDVMAAAAMGHLRGLLRACAWEAWEDPPGAAGRVDAQGRPVERRRRTQSPGAVLHRVDQLVVGLRISTLATLAYARLEPDGAGGWSLHHAAAGHPPFVLREPDGSAVVTAADEGLLLGVLPGERPTTRRAVAAGSTLVAFTDGLVERRGEHLDEGIERLRRLVETGPADVEGLADHLVALADGDDDAAVLVVHLDGTPTG